VAFSQAGNSIVKPYPLATELSTRTGGSYSRDAYIQNGYVEFDPTTNDPYVCKRPALTAAFTFGAVTLTSGQGLFNYGINGTLILFAIGANTLYRLTGGTIGFGSSSVGTWVTATAPSPPLPSTNNGSAAVIVFKNQIMSIGGFLTSSTKYSAAVTSTIDGISWNTITSAAQWGAASGGSGRSRPHLSVLGESLYMMNGDAAVTLGIYYNDCWKSFDGVDWIQVTADMGVASGIFARTNAATVTFNNNIVMIGGQEVNPSTGVLSFANTVISSADGKNWARNSTPPAGFTARRTTAVVFKGAIYCIGGNDAGGYFAQVWKSFDANTWANVYSTGFSGGTGKTFQSAMVLGDKIYAVAYASGAGNIREVYSTPDGVTWTLLATPPWTAGLEIRAVTFRPPLNYAGYPQYPQDVIWSVNPESNAVYFSALDTNYATSWAIPSSAAVTDQYQKAEMNLGQYLLLKNTTDAHYYTSNSITKIADPNFPSSTVRGLAILNSRAYVLDTLGNIRGSEINNPTKWPALDYIRADFIGDSPVCLARFQNYLVVFKVGSTMFFQSSGKAIGNSVSPVLNANMMVGCGAANSVVEMGNTVFWVSTYGGLRRSVSMLNGLSPQKVSTDDVDRILDANPFATVFAASLKTGGQELYILTLADEPFTTLVYNKSSGKWSVWSSGADGVLTGTLPWRVINRSGLGQVTYMQDRKTNGVYAISDTDHQDTDQAAVVTAITTIIQTPELDMGTNQFKFCSAIDLIGDKYSTTNPVTVSYSDDDGLSSATWGTCDLSLDRPQIYRGGSFRRRTIKFTHTANQPLRASSFQLEIEPGDM